MTDVRVLHERWMEDPEYRKEWKRVSEGITLTVKLSDDEAYGLSQLVKRLNRRNLGDSDLKLVTGDEERGAEMSVHLLREALAAQGYDPR